MIALGALTVLTSGPLLQAQVSQNGAAHGSRVARAMRIAEPLVLDGDLSKTEWLEAPVSSGFSQREPQEGQPASEQTEFRILYTPTTLYIGVMLHDSNPQGIRATDRQRDSSLGNDDTITIALDTFHDHRNTYIFRTNPLGTQYDALVTDEGRTTNSDWDERWQVAARILPGGWSVEFAIPFKSLRTTEESGERSWGLDMERVIRRKNEITAWNNYGRGFRLENVSQAGHLFGLQEIETGLRLRVKPYLLGGFRQEVRPQQLPSEPFRTVTQNASDVGIEVVKYRITPGLTADFTWRTDFAQTDVDNQQVNLDRFPLFFPEKREFFQEGAGIFVFETNRAARLFHSRTIGLSPRRQPVPIVAGTRVTGRLQGFTLGLLNVQTEALPSENVPASNYGVYRLRRSVFSRSSIGATFMNRELAGTPDFNRVYGADANFVFHRYLNIDALVSRSHERNSDAKWVSSGGVNWNGDFLVLGTSWVSVDKDFRNDLGFIPRDDIVLLMPRITLRPRPNSRLIRQIVLNVHSDYYMNRDYDLDSRLNHYDFEVRFHSGDVLAYVHHQRMERLREPFQIRSDVFIPVDTYSWHYSGVDYNSNPARRVSLGANWRRHVGFFGGHLDIYGINPSVRLTESFSVDVAYDVNRIRFQTGEYTDREGVFAAQGATFTDHVVNARINYNFSNRMLTSTTIQYNNAASFLGYNFRLNYIFRPGDNFFLIYNEGRQMDGPFDGEKDRTVQAKLTYSFDF